MWGLVVRTVRKSVVRKETTSLDREPTEDASKSSLDEHLDRNST